MRAALLSWVCPLVSPAGRREAGPARAPINPGSYPLPTPRPHTSPPSPPTLSLISCTDFDKCVCFRQQGLFSPYRYGFTGADCSLRTCPLGKAFDRISSSTPGIAPVVFKPSTLPGAKSNNKLSAVFISAAQSSGYRAQRRDQKFVVRIMTTSAVANAPVAPYGTFAWRFEEDEYYQPEDEIGLYSSPTKSYALSKSSDMSTGVYIYWDPRKGNTPTFETEAGEIAAGDTYEFTLFYNEGDAFEGSDSNTAHQLIECSGRGTCDYESGKCGCLVGYTGEACQRTICPAQCSGHGSCQTELRFASDGLPANALANGYAAAYDGDQQYGCKCDKGYRGSDCGLSESPTRGGRERGRAHKRFRTHRRRPHIASLLLAHLLSFLPSFLPSPSLFPLAVECPSGPDVLGADGGSEGMDCSSRGLCDYATGVCKCFKGFYGERCESQTTLV
jgi:hypothetical protein